MKTYQLIVELPLSTLKKLDFSFLVNVGKGASLDRADLPSDQNYVYYRAKAEGKLSSMKISQWCSVRWLKIG